jgi:RNA polymerase sigma factor (sigma-70 family)
MAHPGLHQLVATLRQALRPPEDQDLTDGQLLDRFLASRDEAAFAALVRRHAPLVLGVCRRVLGNPHDAEDAFQATFLVLAQKAKSVVRRGAVGGWLYTVAYRAALEAKAAGRRRGEMERQVAEMPEPAVTPPEPQDWRLLLDRELNRLPAKYRDPIVLCDLDCLTRREAARRLGLAEGTLSSRLATGRRTLAKRLAAQGVTLSGGALAAALSEGAASAHVPMNLVWSTAKAAALVAAGELAAVATPAAILSKGVLQAMFWAKLKAAVVTAVVVAVVGVSVLVVRAGGSGTAQAAPPSELEQLRKENELLKLNLRVTLEKIKAQEDELAALKRRAEAAANPVGVLLRTQPTNLQPTLGMPLLGTSMSPFGQPLLGTTTSPFGQPVVGTSTIGQPLLGTTEYQLSVLLGTPPANPVADAEAALKALQAAKTPEEKCKAADALERASKKLKEQLKGAP